MNANRIKVPALEADIQFTVLIGVWLQPDPVHHPLLLENEDVYEDGFLVPTTPTLFFLPPFEIRLTVISS